MQKVTDMANQSRRYWSGKLHPGDVVFHKGKRCKVARDCEIRLFSSEPVPRGHVPIYYCDAVNFGHGPIYTAPLDDIDIH